VLGISLAWGEAEGFGIAEVFLEGGGWPYAGAQFLLVVTTGEAVYLS
jgi:hypothetical protein